MAWLSRLGGQVYWEPVRGRRTKPLGVWKIAQAGNCTRLLQALEPFLVIKRQRALDAIAFIQKHHDLS